MVAITEVKLAEEGERGIECGLCVAGAVQLLRWEFGGPADEIGRLT
jgi:hypothetical protein